MPDANPNPVAVPTPEPMGAEEEALSLDDERWETLLVNMEAKRCTPFLGAGASTPPLPTGLELANELAKKYKFPLKNQTDLASVTQYLSIQYEDPFFPKYKIKQYFRSLRSPDFSSPTQIHSVLADLGLSIYVTTNYDDYLEQALQRKNRKPMSEVCRWNTWVRENIKSFFNKEEYPDFVPSNSQPLVFHLHGLIDHPESMVLTEDDYVDFLISLGTPDPPLIPPLVQGALSSKSVLFLGYGLSDWNFRVLFRTVGDYLRKSASPVHVSVQLLRPRPENRDAVLAYLNKYFGALKIRVFWGTCQQFANELCERRRLAANAVMGI